ncbi:unnamed protein product [Caenorhabditis angaria]|uniref:Uncharacterized protein n=1 Tax=Caenorhabditis angaria TaxID=860376 RepID=A0A9P1N8N5_9PELO|nr:unnamed protein product [Caenorhabditis angaria]
MASLISGFCALILIYHANFRQMAYHLNVKIILIAIIFTNLVITGTTSYNFSSFFYKNHFPSDNCEDFFFVTSQCSQIRKMFICAFVFQTCCHVLLVIERTWATFRLSKYDNDNCVIAKVGIFISLLISMVTTLLVTMDEKEELMTTCMAFSSTSIGNNIFVMFRFQACIEICCFFAYYYLHNFNRSKRHRFMNLNDQYQLDENVQMIRQFSPLFLVSTGLISIYLMAIQLLRLFRNCFTATEYRSIAVNIFIIPHISCASFLIILYMMRKIHKERLETRLKAIDTTFVESRAHMDTIMKHWDNLSPRKLD